jgi:hypothetical protein
MAAAIEAVGAGPGEQSRASPALRIVVIEGEGAVNILQQRTAVTPVVEVRDRNDQPVGGAVVSFAVRGRGATFAGGQLTSVTTGPTGRAVAAGFSPTSRGIVQISVRAAVQGQAATATNTQTNVATAAEVASVAAGAQGPGGGVGLGTIVGATAGTVGGLYAYREVRNVLDGPPPMLTGVFARQEVGVALGTRFSIGITGSWQSEGDDHGRLDCEFGDGASQNVPVLVGCQHVYSAPGTYTVRVTMTDYVGRSALVEGTIVVTTLTGAWRSSQNGGVYDLSQTGASISGTFTPPSGSGGAPVSGSVQPSASFSAMGTITMTLPQIVGNGVVAATFSGLLAFDDINRITGVLNGPGFADPFVTLTR